MAEAVRVQCGDSLDWTADASYSNGDVLQLPDGRAGVATCDITTGLPVGVETGGVFKMTKTANFVFLKGGRAYWDHSANKVHYLKVSDRDFYLGRFSADALAAATECYVALNVDPKYDIDMHTNAFLTVPTGTQVVGAFGFPKLAGGSQILELGATSEAQAIDLLSVDKFSLSSNWIAEIIIRPAVNGTGSTVDFNAGVANGTSTTDADATTEHVLFHVDGGATTILAQSKDGTVTNAAATGAVSISAGSAVANRTEFWIDGRDPADPQLYVNGALILGSTTFTCGGSGPLGLLVHLEKTTGTETGKFIVDECRVRLGQ